MLKIGNIYYIGKKLSDINGVNVLKELTIAQLRKMSEILVIDDNEFAYLPALKQHEYNLTYKVDVDSLKDVEAYDIILCDIRGIGKFLRSKYEGAYLIKEIKEKYPNKVVIAYTANSYDAEYQEFLSFADDVVPKGLSIEDWSSLLDKKLKENANPVNQWNKTRAALLSAGVDTIRIATIEAVYVKAIENENFESIKKMYENEHTPEANIMKSLLQTIIGKIIEKV